MSFHDLRLTGAGGGGKSGSGGYSESPNTLRAKQTLRLLALVSEGVTGGLVNGAKSIYCDDVPVQNADGSYNFEGVSFEIARGERREVFAFGPKDHFVVPPWSSARTCWKGRTASCCGPRRS